MQDVEIKIVSGLSGSGKSTALRTLEDEGYYCIDNLPPQLLIPFVELCEKRRDIKKIAVGIDVRTHSFWEGMDRSLEEFARRSYKLEIIFLEAEDSMLVRRFSETRRPHPLSKGGDILSGIGIEREITRELRARANWIIDTTHLNVHQLRGRIVDYLRARSSGEVHVMILRLQSFGFKYGLPLDSDIVFDARYIPNPFFEPSLRNYSGFDDSVYKFVMSSREATEFVDRIVQLLVYLIPKYRNEGKFHLTVSIGCTGGRHRSVVLVEEIGRKLNYERVEITHRDVEIG